MSSSRFRTLFLFCACLMAVVFLLRWIANATPAPDEAPAAAEAPVTVSVLTLQPQAVTLSETLPGRVAASRRVEIRPQVGGILLDRPVREGMRVEAGQVLFQIDPAPLKADLATAEAVLERARAAEAHARRAMERADGLLAGNAISRERHDAARNDLAVARATLAEAQAGVSRRQLDLAFATVRAPVAGYIASGLVEEGGLATPTSDRALAVVQELDRVYVDLRLPSASLAALRAAAGAGSGAVEIIRPDRQPHPSPGRLAFSDLTVDPGTGTLLVRVEVDNPGLTLLPGQYVRARVPTGVLPAALLVPEDAVIRTGTGRVQLVTVTAEGRALRQEVQLGETVGQRVVVRSGLNAGDRVVVQGQDRVPDGIPGGVPVQAAALDTGGAPSSRTP